MEFKYKGKRQVLRGIQEATIEWSDGRTLHKEVEQCAQLFALQAQGTELCATQLNEQDPIFFSVVGRI